MNNITLHGSASRSAGQHAHKKHTDTNAIKNTYVRKLTSIALMAIMVAGGLTFAIPGMEPAYAQNPNLQVSAAGQNADNEIAVTNIVEVVVNDDDIGDIGDAEPRVIVDGTILPMYQIGSGAWYGYFAAAEFESALGLTGCAADTDNPGIDRICDATATEDVLANEPARGSPDTQGATGPILYLLDLDEGTFDIVYEKAGGDQTVRLDLDDPATDISLDRNNYPQNTGVVITIDDQALNVDPTSEDTWTFGTNGNLQFYGDAQGLPALVTAAQERNGNITAAQEAYETAISDAEFDYAEAKQQLDDAIELADDVITNPIANAVDKARLIAEFGQGDRDVATSGVGAIDGIDVSTINPTDNDPTNHAFAGGLSPGNDPNTYDDDYKGLRVLLFESLYGAGDRDEDAATSDDYKGRLLVNYEMVAGTGDRDSNDSTSDDYKGTALIALELVDGNGDRDVSVPANADVDTNGTIDGTESIPDDYRGTARINYDAALTTALANIDGTDVSTGLEAFDISDSNNLLTCDSGCTQVEGMFWITFTEDGKNNSKFNNAPDDEPNLKTVSDARRGLSFSVEYDDSVTSDIEYATTNIVIDAGAEWNSGQEIAVTLTDSDANTNSLSEETLEVTEADRIIPTIKIGDPFTLAGVTSVELETADGDDTDTDRDTRTDRNPTVTDISDILVVDSGDYTGNSTLTINLGEWSDVNDFLPQNHETFVGTHMINYDISSLPDAASITLYIGDEDYTLVTVDDDDDLAGTQLLTTPAFVPGDDTTDPENFGALYDDETGNIIDSDEATSLVIELVPQNADGTVINNEAATGSISDAVVIIDIFGFGLDGGSQTETDDGEIETEIGNDNVNNAIYRLELVEDGDSSNDFIGTLEYIGLNQINILDVGTYTGIEAISDAIILVSDDDSVSVEYLDLDSTGDKTLFTAEANTPTHSGSVTLDSDGYKVADVVTVTVEDADLNVDSSKADIYTVNESDDKISSSVANLLTVSFDGNDWVAGCGDMEGLYGSQFTLQETGDDTGVFEGTFAIPANYCDSGDATTVTGTDVSVEYVDFRDDSGSLISVTDSAGIRSNTGSVELDRTVYPVPFGDGTVVDDAVFATHNDDNPLAQGDLTVYVSITDADFDTSSNGIDSIEVDGDAPLTVSIIRGSDDMVVSTAGNTGNPIDETGSSTGVFEHEVTISYNDGLDSAKCPVGLDACILQGDILHVEYADPFDASGSDNTVTDSATFDLRNGVLQTDQTAYLIGSDMIVTLIEQDLNLDSGSTEAYTLDLIEWDSDAGTATLADGVFDAVPSNLLETGDDTGIFQVVITVPSEIDSDKLERGEEITLEYVDQGPSGSDYVGDKDEEITTTAYTSNFGATIELDQRVYTWTDKVFITVVAPDHNIDSDQVDEVGNDEDYPIRVSTRGNEIENYKLVETGADTGIFTGEVILTGFPHDADGDGSDDARGTTSRDGSGPTNGQIGTESESGISVSFKFSEGETVSSSALIRWNVGEVQWLEASYPASGTGIVRVIDPDMNLNPEAVDNFDVTVWSDTDGGGIDLTVTETNAATGIFEGTVFFGVGVDTSGHRLSVVEGDTVTAQYYDNTLPAPFKETERVRVGATTLIGTVVPPLERVPISDLRAVDSFGNTLDTITVDSQIQLESDLTNGQDKAQDFAYLIQIQDENGVTVSLNWITGSLSEGQSLSPATSWTPTEAGTYDVTAFVWESIENPSALSPTATIAITVN